MFTLYYTQSSGQYHNIITMKTFCNNPLLKCFLLMLSSINAPTQQVQLQRHPQLFYHGSTSTSSLHARASNYDPILKVIWKSWKIQLLIFRPSLLMVTYLNPQLQVWHFLARTTHAILPNHFCLLQEPGFEFHHRQMLHFCKFLLRTRIWYILLPQLHICN